MKTTRRIFLAQSATAIAAAGIGITFPRLAMSDNEKSIFEAADNWSIVISHNASKLESMAAETLAEYWRQSIGSQLPIITDDVASMGPEIVLGNTSRLNLNSISKDLQPQTLDGFVIYPEAKRLYIMGKTQRGTLYGVYDFLEQEMGIRFLTPDFTHIPSLQSHQIKVRTRKFDPVFAYRDIHLADAKWSVSQRLNGSDKVKAINVHLGGTAFIRPKFVHTFGLLVPAEKYFSSHPEYYALKRGERVPATANGVSGQLCLTNIDVLNIMAQTTKEWLAKYTADPRFYAPDEIALVSISPNDNHDVCECPSCQKVNREEGCDQGTLIRAVNAVAVAIEQDYPNARIETLGDYSGVRNGSIPKTPPRHNVLIRFATGDWDKLQPMDSDTNLEAAARFKAWAQYAPGLYTWNYHNVMANHFKPYPDLKYIDEHIRYQYKHGVQGYFSENTKSRRAAFADIRHYVASRLLWRPELKAHDLVEEYCHLSYGQAARYILEYVDTIDKHARAQNTKLFWTDGTRVGKIEYDYPFLLKINDILQAAEDAASDTITKDRIVREHRLGLWYLILDKGLSGEAGGTIPLPLQWHFKTDPGKIGEKEKWFQQIDFQEWDDILVDKSWTYQGHDYHGTAWYAVNFEIDSTLADRVKIISFGGVDGRHDLYLDGQLIDQRHEDPGKTWNQPFTVSLLSPLAAGKHVLVMQVTKENHAAGVWQPVYLRDPAAGLPEEVLQAAERFLKIAPTDPILSQLKGWHAPRSEEIDKFATRVKWMLQQNNSSGIITQPAALLPNTHTTYTVVEDATSETGQVVVQTADRKWTLGQSITWKITERIKSAAQNGQLFKLKVRVRTEQWGGSGPAFRFGYAIYHQNWSGNSVDEIKINAAQITGQKWQWYELPQPVKFVESERGMVAYVTAENNPQGVGKIYVDSFILEPA